MSGMNYNEFKQLAQNFKGLMKDYDSFLNDFLMVEGNKCLANTKRRTPVDTSRLRNAWQLSGPFRRGTTKYAVIHNNVEYASWVEDGHRIVNQYGTYGFHPGVHMARIALAQTSNKLPQNFEKAFANFCRGKGIG